MEEATPVPEQTPTRHYTFERGGNAKKKRALFLLVFLLIAGGLVFGASRFLGSSTQQEEAAVSPTPTEFIFPTDTPAPTEEEDTTPTPKPTTAAATPTSRPTSNPVDSGTGLDRSDISVEVLNGSGETGVAGKASDYLKSLGYGIASVGNADNTDYQGVTIQVKSSRSSFAALLKKDLSSDYTVTSATSDLSASSSADALVIIGK